jgi:hypothetical protein
MKSRNFTKSRKNIYDAFGISFYVYWLFIESIKFEVLFIIHTCTKLVYKTSHIIFKPTMMVFSVFCQVSTFTWTCNWKTLKMISYPKLSPNHKIFITPCSCYSIRNNIFNMPDWISIISFFSYRIEPHYIILGECLPLL